MPLSVFCLFVLFLSLLKHKKLDNAEGLVWGSVGFGLTCQEVF